MPYIKEITAVETYIVRHPILRNGKPIENCHFEGDERETTIHFGLFDNEKLIGVISVFEHDNTTIDSKKQVQIRGMAVLGAFQKKGYSTQKCIFGIKKLNSFGLMLGSALFHSTKN
jgi:hypothetical protein